MPTPKALLRQTCRECGQPIQQRSDGSKTWCACDVRLQEHMEAGGAPFPKKWLDEPGHQHYAKHSHRCDNGTVYEVCNCGASRMVKPGEPAPPWHACKLCCSMEVR